MRRALAALALAACDGTDPCAELDGTCLTVRIESRTIDELDQLELDVLYGGVHGTTTTQLAGDGLVSLPVSTAIVLELAGVPSVTVGVVAAGKQSGTVVGTGAASTAIATGDRAAITITLAPPAACVAGGLYCGGDKLAGDPQTLYQCNGGGAPRARGVCTAGCLVRPATDDACRADGGTCVEGGFYCGGDKLDGDPQALYRCASGAGVDGVVCADGCLVAPPGMDDRCR